VSRYISFVSQYVTTKEHSMPQRFPLGRMVMTLGVQTSIPMDEIIAALSRHAAGDWGAVDAEDVTANDQAVNREERLLSAYETSAGRIWILTEADRSITTVLLPDEY
jgi:hypothetical protein